MPTAQTTALSPATRALHHAWLLEVTALPTAAGRESRIIDWIRRWTSDRPDLAVHEDSAGNLHIHFAADPFTTSTTPASLTASSAPPQSKIQNPKSKIEEAPLYFTAHLDHPAFVVERILAPAALELSFRGGVMDDYFTNARIVIHSADGTHPATLTGQAHGPSAAFKYYSADLDHPTDALHPGDVATWELPPPLIEDGLLYTHACDDLASLVAALAAFDILRQERSSHPTSDIPHPTSLTPHPTSPIPLRLLFTRAEEIGFIGAIAACRNGSIPKSAKIIALEVSRSFDDSPIGGGPIVRVGDRLSTFCPSLTAAIARRAEDLSGAPAIPTAAEKRTTRPEWRWQRKLMPGGACEASVFCSAGYDATCLCLPLGNYHNMADLAAVQAGTNTTPPRVGPEYIAISDFDGLVDLLIACGKEPLTNPSLRERIDKLWQERAFVLQER